MSGRVSVHASPRCSRSCRKALWYSKVSPARRVTEMRCVPSAGSSETVSLQATASILAWSTKISPSWSPHMCSSYEAPIVCRASFSRSDRCSGSRTKLFHPRRLIGCGVAATTLVFPWEQGTGKSRSIS